MLRLVLFGAGKTIFHKGVVCEIIETHNQIRRLLPLIGEDLSQAKATPFWVPLKAANRKENKKRRIRRLYISGKRRVFPSPHFTGEPRPAMHPDDGAPLVPFVLESRTPTPESSDALSCTLSKRVPPSHMKWNGFHLVQSVSVSTVRRTAKGFFSRESVEDGLKKMRTHNVMKAALREIVFSRQSPSQVARTYALPLDQVNVYASRLRKHITTQKPDNFAPKNTTENMQKAKKSDDLGAEVLSSCGISEME